MAANNLVFEIEPNIHNFMEPGSIFVENGCRMTKTVQNLTGTKESANNFQYYIM